ncbi:hypothetical protein CMV30_14665 [Nibricoccus aquaticus]|uniref:Uncharacterized protein n=1 Tax=Nibricoccus aquaticus TaxID=2576891 RepID=A0A290QFP3_9BACT|nr:hypothetical protein [Nibricoccus aquaticus]ATC65096.1 hypothetical protein CMV30_14665 [Nibricoccus aquaticus]
MPKPAYEPVLSAAATTILVGLSRAKQRSVIGLIEKLAEHPQQDGDYSSVDDAGRAVQHVLLGEWHLSYWADHAAVSLVPALVNNLSAISSNFGLISGRLAATVRAS